MTNFDIKSCLGKTQQAAAGMHIMTGTQREDNDEIKYDSQDVGLCCIVCNFFKVRVAFSVAADLLSACTG